MGATRCERLANLSDEEASAYDHSMRVQILWPTGADESLIQILSTVGGESGRRWWSVSALMGEDGATWTGSSTCGLPRWGSEQCQCNSPPGPEVIELRARVG